MQLFIETTDERPADVTKRRFKEFSRNGMNAIGVLWDRLFKLRHFDDGAADRYGYARRRTKYQEGKERAVRNGSRSISPDAARPLIRSGALRRAARLRQVPRSVATRTTVTIPTPFYAAMKPRRADIPNLGLEMTATLQSEELEMQQEYHREVEDDLNTYRATRTTRVGS